MRVGVLARAEDRGLGLQTWEFARNLDASACVVDMGPLARGFPMHLDRYPGAPVARYEPGVGLDETAVRDWLSTVDVVYAAETFYDPRFAGWCRDARVGSVLHVNPEFFDPSWAGGPQAPTRWWAPTTWRLRHLPDDTTVVPVPVAADRFAPTAGREPGPLRVLHVAGHRAANDRNGTQQMLAAVRRLAGPAHIHIATQDDRMPTVRSQRRTVTVSRTLGGVDDYWSLYDGFDLLVLPRRYGGLCLPAQEAMAAGLAVAMTDCPPNRDWPVLPIRAQARGQFRTQAGPIDLWDVQHIDLIRLVDRLAADPDGDELRDAKAAARDWAAAHSWDALRVRYLALLAQAADAV